MNLQLQWSHTRNAHFFHFSKSNLIHSKHLYAEMTRNSILVIMSLLPHFPGKCEIPGVLCSLGHYFFLKSGFSFSFFFFLTHSGHCWCVHYPHDPLKINDLVLLTTLLTSLTLHHTSFQFYVITLVLLTLGSLHILYLCPECSTPKPLHLIILQMSALNHPSLT